MALNHIQITDAKPKDKAHKLVDVDGLHLIIQPNGAKLAPGPAVEKRLTALARKVAADNTSKTIAEE